MRFDNEEGGIEPGVNAGYTLPNERISETERRIAVADHYRSAVEELLDAGKRVILVYPIPEVGWNVPRRLYRQVSSGDYTPVTTDIGVFRQRTNAVFEAFDSVPQSPDFVRIYPHELLCDTYERSRCATADRNTIFYLDDDHLNREGADLLAEHIFHEVNRIWSMSFDN